MAGQQRRDELGLDRFDRKVSCAEVLVELWARCWWGRMVKVAANRLKDRDAAEDIAQEAFMKALSIARSDPSAVEAVRDPCCWLVAITRKLASGVLRTERRRRRLRRENASEIGGQRRPRFWIVLLCVAIAGCGPEAPPTEASGPCPTGDCRIELEHITRITDADDPGILPPEIIWLQETEAGTFVSASLDMTQIAEFGPDGRLIGVIGRAGQGPGEFARLVTLIPGSGDTLFAPDKGQGRITVFGPDRVRAGTLPMPFLPPDLVMPDGSFLLAQQIGRKETIGYPMHVVDREGRVVRSFGTDEPQYRPDLDDILTRNVAPGRDGTVWAMAPARYILERWDPSTGEQLQSTRIRSEWFRESIEPDTDETVRPPPRVEGLWEDENGLVWTIVSDADVDWEPPAGANEHRPFDLQEYNGVFDWVIEVVDPGSGRVLASRRFSETLWYRPPSRILVSPVDTILTIVAYDVWKPTLQQGR